MATHAVPHLAYAMAFLSAGVLVVLAGLARQGRWNDAAGPIMVAVLLAALAALVSFYLRERKPKTTAKALRRGFLIDTRGVTVRVGAARLEDHVRLEARVERLDRRAVSLSIELAHTHRPPSTRRG